MGLRRLIKLGAALAAPLWIGGCAGLLVSADDSRCAQDLAAVERIAHSARGELADGLDAQARQPTLARLVDAAAHARASCAYEKPKTPSSDRAKGPKPGQL